MSGKTILSIILILLGVTSGLLVIFAYARSGGNPAIALILLAGSVVCIIAGTVLAFSKLLDRQVSPVIEEIHADIEDDIQDLKEHRITNTHGMIAIVSIALFAFSFFIFRFHKIEARWGVVPVIIPTMIGMALLAWFILRTGWFQMQIYTPMWIFLIPTIGFIVTFWLGLTKTENLSLLTTTPQESAAYNTYRSTGFILQTVGSTGDLGLDFAIPDCDGDACVVFLVIGLIILVFVLVVGSALIPHFWLLSGSILLVIMALIAIHDLRVRRLVRKEA